MALNAKTEEGWGGPDTGTTYHAEIICQGRHAGGFIGRNGSSIESLRTESGCAVKVSHFDMGDTSGRKQDRLVQLSGNSRQLFLGLKGVASRFAAISEDNVQFSKKQRDTEGDGTQPEEEETWNKFCLTLLVPSGCVGRIVGSKGRKIREISEEHGCKVNLSRDFFPPRPSHRRTQLQHHEAEGLAHTAFKICEIIHKTDPGGGGPYPVYANPAPPPPPVSSNGYITTTHHRHPHYPHPGAHPHPGQHPHPPPNPYAMYHHPPTAPNASIHPRTHAPEYPYNYGAHPHAHPYPTQPAPPPPPSGSNPSAHPPMSYGAAPQYPYGVPAPHAAPAPNTPNFNKFAPY